MTPSGCGGDDGGPHPKPAVPAPPRATLRLQFHHRFGFADAIPLVPYIARLGVSHIYASPFLTARPGSSHGYDIIDHSRINPEVGDTDSFDALVTELHRHGLGLILDFVPNHMGVGGADNPWWLDVLEWGQASPFADFFDIDWAPAEPSLTGKVLLPFLGDYYGRVLERGELNLAFDDGRGTFSVWYFDHRFPIGVADYPGLLRTARRHAAAAAADADADPANTAAAILLGEIGQAFARIQVAPRPTRQQAVMRQRTDELKAWLAAAAGDHPPLGTAIARTVAEVNGTPGHPASFQTLHDLLERQVYRVAYWRVATAEINYRRFFDINDLAGLRMENPDLFELSHHFVFRLITEGKIQGLRLDHIDGLYDPTGYCERLQDRTSYLLMQTAAATPGAAVGVPPPTERPRRDHLFYLAVEKILAAHERLREDWPVDGTTGYDALNLINGVFVDPGGEVPLTALWHEIAGSPARFEEIAVAAKRQVVQTNLLSELSVLASDLHAIARQSWRTRDFTLAGVQAALVDILAQFPVYRTYIGADGPTEADRRDLDWAVRRARKAAGATDTSPHAFIHQVLSTDLVAEPTSHPADDVRRTAMKFQQFTGPVMAKAVEDTALYRYFRLISLNDVGGDPDRFGVAVSAVHRANQERLRRFPYGLLATATHDHKRGEDTRARINVLSECAGEWRQRVQRWARLNQARKRDLDGQIAPDPSDEYLFYQTLVGVWPLEVTEPDGVVDHPVVGRVADYLVKAMREAKRHSSWNEVNAAYEDATVAFVRATLDPARAPSFLADFLDFHQLIARAGAINGLAQTMIKLTSPGVPDLYQGSDYWDLSLVDPDNRRPVDFASRVASLAALAEDGDPLDPALGDTWRDGRIKQAVIARVLGHRRRYPRLFSHGTYHPLAARGPAGDQVIAYERRLAGRTVTVVVPRLVAGLLDPAESGLGIPGTAWEDTVVAGTAEDAALAEASAAGPAPGTDPAAPGDGPAVPGCRRDLLTGRAHHGGPPWPAAALFADLPLAVLIGEAS